MEEISESDRFECKVINVISKGDWYGVTVEEIASGGRVYFGRTKPELFNYKPGDILYIGVKALTIELEDRTMEVSLYDADDNKLDWTII
ncbi:MAG: hypothetical protein WBL02_04390 [Methanomethylovorans sp.]|uniref:hypothetical protein n=1 Tax=Methanomethylovorans sp. TaxID=2758717 RepID=UPI000B118B9F|nr:hypothetical protein [Methanomethylovorans sp.]